MAKIVKLNVMISASTKGLSAGITKARSSLNTLSAAAWKVQGVMKSAFGGAVAMAAKGAAALGASVSAAAGALAYLTKKSIDAIGDQNDFAKTVGLSYNRLRALQFAAGQTGVSAEKLDAAFGKMSDTIGSAMDGNKAALDVFDRLGIDFEKLQSMRPEQRFDAIANAINRIQDPSQKMAAARDIFGKSGGALINLFEDSGAAIQQAANALETFGISLSDLDIATVDAAGDAMGKLGLAIEGIGNQLAVNVSPYIIQAEKDTTAWLDSMGGIPAIVDGGISMLNKALDWILNKTDYLVVAWQQLTKLWDYVPDFVKNGVAAAIPGAGIPMGADALLGSEVDQRRANRAAGGGVIGGIKKWGVNAEQAVINEQEAAAQAEVQAGHDRRRQQRMEQMSGAGAWLLNTPSPVSQIGMQAPAQTRTREREDPALQVLRNIEANTGKNKIAFAGPN